MTAQIFFTPNFPHATIEGYDMGCTGTICPGKAEHGWSCAQARERFNGDYQWRTWILSGMTPAQIVDAMQFAAVEARTALVAHRIAAKAIQRKKRMTPTHGTAAMYNRGCHNPTTCPSEFTCTDARRADRIARARAAGQEARNPLVHGNYAAYSKFGCRNPDTCPSKIAGGISCTEASAAYRKQLRDRKKEAA